MSRIYFSNLFVLLLIFSLSACNNKKEESLIHHASKLLESHPDSTLLLLQSVTSPEQLSKPLRAEYYLLLGRANYRTGAPVLEKYLPKESVDYFVQQNDAEKIAYAYFLHSKSVFDPIRNVGDSERALLDNLEARKYAEKAGDTELLGHIYYDIGNIYYTKYYNDEALKNYEKSLSYFIESNNVEDIALALGKIGSVYNTEGHPDSALVFQQRALERIGNRNDSSGNYLNTLSALYKNLALSHGKLKNYELEKEGLLQAYQILPQKEGRDANILLYLISMVYMKLDKPDSVLYYGKKYIELPDETLREKAFRVHHWYKVYKFIGKLDLGIENLEKFVFSIDQIYNEELSKSILEVQQKYDKEVLENEYNNVLIQRLYLTIAVITLLLLAVAAGWYFWNKIRRKETQLLEAEQALSAFGQLLSKQDEKNEKLTTFLVDKLDLTRKVAQMNVVSTDNTKDFIKQYNKVFDKNLLDEINWDNIYPIINDLYDGFVVKVEARYPGLSEKDLQMCCFIRAGFKTEEISVLLNYTQNTVRVKKSRLSKKIGFNDYDSFLTHIMTL